MRREKKFPKFGCFETAVTDLRVTEQGQEIEVRAGGRKKDFGFISRNSNSSESGSTLELRGAWGGKDSREMGFKRGFNWEKYHGLSRFCTFLNLSFSSVWKQLPSEVSQGKTKLLIPWDSAAEEILLFIVCFLQEGKFFPLVFVILRAEPCRVLSSRVLPTLCRVSELHLVVS